MKLSAAVIILILGHTAGSGMDDLDVRTDERKQRVHIIDSLDLLAYLGLLVLTIITLWIFKKKRLWFIHESGLSVIFGLIVGAIMRYTGKQTAITKVDVMPVNESSSFESAPDVIRLNISEQMLAYGLLGIDNSDSHRYNDIQEKATFDSEIFFYIILPPIIFHAGYSMRKKQFFDNLGSILTFALLGTLISTVIIACIMWLVVQFITLKIRFLDTLYFGAIVSATDPVTTIAIFSDIHVDPMINSLVLGESLLNDAVAIVLCSAIEDYSALYLKGNPDTFEVEAFFRTIGNFFFIFLGSIGLGALIGVLTSLLTKFTRIRDFHLLETSLFFLMSYSSYLLAEICEMSGIVSVLFCGIFQAHYTFHNLSLESKLRTQQLFEVLHFLLENFIFSYIGVSMFTFSHHRFQFAFILAAFFAIAVARAANIYPLSFLLNLGRKNKIPTNFQHMLWFSGLRGAMAFALAMQNTMSEARQMFLTTTSLISIFTVIFCGGMTSPLLGVLKIPTGVPDAFVEDIESCNEDDCTPSSTVATPRAKSALARGWKRLDSVLMKPLLTNSQPTLQDTLPWLGPIARVLTPSDQIMGVHISRQSQEGNLVTNNFSSIEREDSLSCGD
eukprot:TRINITY_DN11580_c0_g1_i1.p1 TRINITY_DN11580_c0_g1~~TRINITY_DN11580_c0_g1_i1.p1  ORF type:complete len:614 (+),score=151.22 TRINITY_DN11580_c0_g1_i1:384-2225(+)